MKPRSLFWNVSAKLLLVATVSFLSPSISFSQNIGGIAGAIIQGAISAQVMQQYQNSQRRSYEPRQRSRGAGNSDNPKAQRNPDEQNDKARISEKRAADIERNNEEFLKIAPAAKDLIEDASTFVKENPSNPKLLEFIQKLNELNSALAAQNVVKLKQLMETVVGDLHREPAYAKLEADRREKKRLETERYLPELIKTAKQQQVFVLYYIRNNPTSPHTTAFISAIKETESSLAVPDLGKLRALTSKIDVLIREAGLRDEFVKSTNVLADKSAPVSSDKSVDSNPIRKTDKNAFLVDGNPKDFVLMYNSSPQAPHITKNLSGKFEFENNEVKACLYQPHFVKSQAYLLTQKLRDYQLQKVEIYSSECPRNGLSAYDVVAVERGEFAQLGPETSMPLYSELEGSRFKWLQTITAAQIEEMALQQKNERMRIEENIQSESAAGYGIVFVGSQVDSICMVTKNNEKAHRQILLNNIERLTPELGSMSPVPVVKSTSDEAYKALQRRECQAIYSSAPELKSIIAALKKNDVGYSVSSVWITEEAVQVSEKIIKERELVAQRDDQERKTKIESAKKLRDSIAKEEMASNQKKQQVLQSQYGTIAAAKAAEIATVVREATDGRPDWQQTAAFEQFFQFSTAFQNLSKNRWELQSFNSEIYDYGHAVWKGRQLETAFVRVSITLRNRILGEYKDECIIFGRINDAEFSMVRDTIEVGCGLESEISSWKKIRNFESQWVVGLPGS
jgi:hypothetical protein